MYVFGGVRVKEASGGRLPADKPGRVHALNLETFRWQLLHTEGGAWRWGGVGRGGGGKGGNLLAPAAHGRWRLALARRHAQRSALVVGVSDPDQCRTDGQRPGPVQH